MCRDNRFPPTQPRKLVMTAAFVFDDRAVLSPEPSYELAAVH
jgi:hypothetical protein